MVKRTTSIFEFDSLYLGQKPISSIYFVDANKHVYSMWDSINNCFSAGYWNSALAWTNVDGWAYLK